MTLRPICASTAAEMLLLVATAAFAQPAVPPAVPPPPASADTANARPQPAPSAAARKTDALEPKPPEPKRPVVHAKWDTGVYGFVELDTIHDTTQSFLEIAGNGAIARPGTYAADHGRTQLSGRNSRIGFLLGAPEYHGIKATAQLEMDFFGNQPASASEAALYQNPTFRIRHMNLVLHSEALDVMFGQSWELFGWQAYFDPATVEIQGMPGEVYSRAPQIRVSRTFDAGSVDIDLALAAVRPPERDASTPDGQAGLRLRVNRWKAWHNAGSTGQGLDDAAIGVSGLYRRFAVPNFAAAPTSQVTAAGYGLSIDTLIPLISGTKVDHGNALTFTGSFVTGQGDADVYTGLSGGVANAALPNPAMASPAPTYSPDVDNGLVEYTADGALHAVQWTSYIVGLQYYLPPKGHIWLAADYSHMESDNAARLGAAAKVWNASSWADGCLFVDVTPAVRLGAEVAYFDQTYVDSKRATDLRGQFSAFFLF